MHWTNIGLILVAGLDLGMALLIWLRNPKNKINITFSLAILFLAFWSFGASMFRESNNLSSAWFWTYFQNFFGPLTAIPLFLFSIYFPYQDIIIEKWYKITLLICILIISIFVFIPALWTKKILLISHENDYDINRLGIFSIGLIFYILMFLTFNNFRKKYIKSTGFLQSQLRFIMISTGIMAVFGSVFGIIIPLLLTHNGPYWIGPYFSIFMITLLVYFTYYYQGR